MGLAELPRLDLVVLSHHLCDYFDRRAAAELPKNLRIISEPHAVRKLHRQGLTAPISLQSWETWSTTRGGATLSVTSVPAKHAPAPLDKVVPPVMGSVLQFAQPGQILSRIYITGDTLMFDGLAEIPQRFPDLDLCLLHLGGTKIAGILLTMDAAQGAEALRTLQPPRAIPLHYDDYTLFRSPLDDFRRSVDRASLATEVTYLERGQTYRFSGRGAAASR